MADKKKMPSTFLNMVVVLTIIAFVSGLALAFTYSGTKDAIAQVQVKKTLKALKDVLPEFDNDPNAEGVRYTVPIEGTEALKPEFRELEFYPAKKGGEYVGMAVKTYSRNAFETPIWLMVGFDKDDKVNKISVLKQKETPGLGTKMADQKFKGQFEGKDPATDQLQVTKDKGKIDAISAATISSRAFCEAVDLAYKALKKGKKTEGGSEAKAEPKAEEAAEEKAEETPAEGSEVKTEDTAEEKTETKKEDKVEIKTAPKAEEKTEAKADQKVETKEVKK